MDARLKIEAQNYQGEQHQWVFVNPQVVVDQAWLSQSWRMVGIFQSVSMPNLHSRLPKTPQYD